jgi:acyl homoserine lactone synthase
MNTFAINRENRVHYRALLTSMFRQRKTLFVDRLGWANMVVENGEERDEADTDDDVVYLITVDDAGRLIGSCRLTPTLGNCLLAGPLQHYLDAPLLKSATSWELTRFAPSSDPGDPQHGRSFANLAAGVLEWAFDEGVTKIFGIAEPPLMGIAGGLGWRIAVEGPPVDYEKGKTAFAFSFPVDRPTIESTKTALQLGPRVLRDGPNLREAAA